MHRLKPKYRVKATENVRNSHRFNFFSKPDSVTNTLKRQATGDKLFRLKTLLIVQLAKRYPEISDLISSFVIETNLPSADASCSEENSRPAQICVNRGVSLFPPYSSRLFDAEALMEPSSQPLLVELDVM